jgi:branched-chain amino acid transport system ATP-binding protein
LFQRDDTGDRERALEILEFLNIIHLKDEFAGNLSFGQQKLLDFERGSWRRCGRG